MNSGQLQSHDVPYVSCFLLVILSLLTLTPLEAFAATTIKADAVAHARGLRTADSSVTYDRSLGFGMPLANLRAESTFDGGLKAFGELYLASRNNSDDAIRIGSFYGSTGTSISNLTLKAGKFKTDYGLQQNFRSDHAEVQNNALIGNPLIDPTDDQIGLSMDVSRAYGEVSLSLTNGSSVDTLDPDRGFATSLNVKIHPFSTATLSLSGYRAYHGDTNAGSSSNLITGDNLFGPGSIQLPTTPLDTLQARTSEPYSGFNRGLGGPPRTLTLGRDLTAWQIDLVASPWMLDYVTGHVGSLRDDISNLEGVFSNPDSTIEWTYYTGEAKVPLDERVYLAGRLARADAKKLSEVPILGSGLNNGSIRRYQLGGGYRFSNNILIKTEYVNSQETVTSDKFNYEGLSLEVSITGYPRIDKINLSKENTTR
ncbi:MAG: hypothetical protein ABEK50_03000 [bacterium]